MSCTGSTMGGPLTQIVSRGAADFMLTAAAMVTYWRLRHSTHTAFATEMICQSFSSSPQFGGPTVSCNLNRTGDLIHRQYIQVDLPGLYPSISTGTTTTYAYVLDVLGAAGSTYLELEVLASGTANPLGGFYAHWTNSAGFALLKSVSISVGNHVIDSFTREFMYCYDQLSRKAGKSVGDMVAQWDTREQAIAYSMKPQRLTIPVPFWYTQVAGNALSLVSLAFHGVTISVEFESLANMIVVSNSDIAVNKTNADGTDSGNAIANTDLTATVLSEYVYLDVAERDKFAEGLFDQLIHCVQQATHTTTESTVNLQLHFNHPMIELIWCVRIAANKAANDYFNFSRTSPSQGTAGAASTRGSSLVSTAVMIPNTDGTFDILVEPENDADQTDAAPNLVGADGRYNLGNVLLPDGDPITTVGLQVNHIARFPTGPAVDHRRLYPHQAHSAVPKNFIFCYPFALFPEEPNPSGSMNFSRLDSVILQLTLHASLLGTQVEVMVFGRNWNVFSYLGGLGGNGFI